MSDPITPVSSTSDLYRPFEVVIVQPPRKRYWLHLVLLLATIFTTLVVGARMELNFQQNLPAFYSADNDLSSIFPLGLARHGSNLLLGIPFSFTVLLILLAHEMGHYVYCVRYGVSATLPFFIPFPTLFGTMGAVIRIRSPIRSRTMLFDIGIAGPIAGFVVAVAVLFVGLALSKTTPAGAAPADIQMGYPLVFRMAHSALVSLGLAHGKSLDGLLLHPTAIAAWVGMFATSLNLLPGGQLDGGHIIFALAPRVHRRISRLSMLILLPMAYFLWAGWFIWAVFIGLTGMRHPMVPEWPPVTGKRRWLAVFALFMLLVTLTPAPFSLSSTRDVIQELRSH